MILYKHPLIAQIDSGLDQKQINWLLSLDNYVQSQGYNHQNQNSELVKERTSLSLFDFQDQFKPIRQAMLDVIHRELGRFHPIENAELLQLTRYRQGQEYQPHYDYFNIEEGKPVHKVDRCATALLYLNDGFEGGATVFPRLNITVFPRQGDMLYFEYPRDVADLTLHAGEAVIKGEKRIASLWIRSDFYSAQDSAADPQSL